MIWIMTNDLDFNQQLHQQLLEKKLRSAAFKIEDEIKVQALMAKKIRSIKLLLTSEEHPTIEQHVWENILRNIAKKIPVIIINKNTQNHLPRIRGTIVLNQSINEIVTLLRKQTNWQSIKPPISKPKKFNIPYYHQETTMKALKSQGYLSILSIHTPQFNKIAIEYGQAAFKTIHDSFQKILFDLWGAPESFRLCDLLEQDRSDLNTYYIMLTFPRYSNDYLPKPGELNQLALRLKMKLSNLLWEEIQSKSNTELSSILKQVPDFYIGHATAIYNKNIPLDQSISQLFKESEKSAHLQKINYLEKTKELFQFLIQSKKILTPHFQGIFNIKNLTLGEIEACNRQRTIRPIMKHIHGFEALIRINKKRAQMLLDKEIKNHFSLKFLQPEILFKLSKLVNLSLELDQACLRQALRYYKKIPYILFANILPRNCYNVDRVIDKIPNDIQLTFEISETEVIRNYGIIKEIRNNFINTKYSIAIDDFGKEFAGINRILKIKPDVIKIDSDLIHNIHKDPVKREFVRGIINATKGGSTLLLAEGVERIEEFKELKKLGIQLVQGFLLHKPQSPTTLFKEIK